MQSHLCLKTKTNFVINYAEKCFIRVGSGSGDDVLREKSSVILVSGLERDDGGLGRDSHRSQRRYRRGKVGYHQGQHIFYSFIIMHWSLSSLPFPLVLMA
jgi:hypothetical protein